MAISSIGVGSGLPLDQLLIDLRNSENNALALIQSRQITAQNQLSAYGKIQSSLEALQKAGAVLTDVSTFGALKTNINGDAIAASATSKAIAGEYRITVESLAKAQTLVTAGVADRSAALGDGGKIVITLNDNSVKTLDLSGKNTSLDGLINAINAESDLGLRATMVNDGSGTPYRLLLTATATGTKAAMAKIEVAANIALDGFLKFDQNIPAANIQEDPPGNAQMHINGIAIESQRNTIENAIEGVTISLSKVSAQPTTLSVARDDTVASKAINAFVMAYNNLQTTIKSLTAYDANSQKASALTGDNLLRNVQNKIREVINVTAQSGTIRQLSGLGIKTDIKDGTLKVDDKVLAAAINNTLTDVRELFTGDNGVVKTLNSAADAFLRSDGKIKAAQDGISLTASNLQKQFDATQARIDAKMEMYRRQFSSLDSTVAKMNSISSYLTQQLSMLSNLGNNKS